MSRRLVRSAAPALLALALIGCNGTPGAADATKTAAPNTAATKPPEPTITASELTAARKADGVCALDTLDGVIAPQWTVKKGAISTLIGWAATSAKTAPAQFTLVLKGEQAYGFAAKTGLPRPDVATALASPALANAGYSFAADFSALPPGTYQALLLVAVGDGNEACDLGRQIIVAP